MTGLQASQNGGFTRRVLSGTAWGLFTQLAPFAVNIVLTPYVLSGLGVARFGVMLLIFSMMAMLSVSDGVGQAAQRDFAFMRGAGDNDGVLRLMVSVAALMALLCAVVLALPMVFAPQVVGFFHVSPVLNEEAVFLLRAMLGVLVLLVSRAPLQSYLLAGHRYAAVSLTGTSTHVIYAIGMIATVRSGLGLRGVALTMLAQQAAYWFVYGALLARELGTRHFRAVPWPLLSGFAGRAAKVQLTAAITLLGIQKDQLVLGRLIGAERATPYNQGIQFSQQLRWIPMNALSPLLSFMGGDVGGAGDRVAVLRAERMQRVWVKLLGLWFAVGVPTAYVGIGKWLVQLPQAGPVAAALMVGHLAFLLPAVKRIWALSVGRPEIDVWSGAIGLALNACLTVILVVTVGPLGTLAATVSAGIAQALLFDRRTSRVLTVTPGSCLRGLPVVAMAISATTTGAILWAFEAVLPTGPLGLIGCAVLGGPVALVYWQIVLGNEGLPTPLGMWRSPGLTRRAGHDGRAPKTLGRRRR